MSGEAAEELAKAQKGTGEKKDPLPRKQAAVYKHRSPLDMILKTLPGGKNKSVKCQSSRASGSGEATTTTNLSHRPQDNNANEFPGESQSSRIDCGGLTEPTARTCRRRSPPSLLLQGGETSHLRVQSDVINDGGWYDVSLNDDDDDAEDAGDVSGKVSHGGLHEPGVGSAGQQTRQAVHNTYLLARKTFHMVPSPRQFQPGPMLQSLIHKATASSDQPPEQSTSSLTPVQPFGAGRSVLETPPSATASSDARFHPALRSDDADLLRRSVSSPSPASSPKDPAALTFKKTMSERSFQSMSKFGWVLGVRRNPWGGNTRVEQYWHPGAPSKTTITQRSLWSDEPLRSSPGARSVMLGLKKALTPHPPGTSVRPTSFSGPSTSEEANYTDDAKFTAATASRTTTNQAFREPGPATTVMLATARHLQRKARHVRQHLSQRLLSALMCGVLDSTAANQRHPAVERFLERLQAC